MSKHSHLCTCICIDIYTLVSRIYVPMSTRSDVKKYLKIKQAPCWTSRARWRTKIWRVILIKIRRWPIHTHSEGGRERGRERDEQCVVILCFVLQICHTLQLICAKYQYKFYHFLPPSFFSPPVYINGYLFFVYCMYCYWYFADNVGRGVVTLFSLALLLSSSPPFEHSFSPTLLLSRK